MYVTPSRSFHTASADSYRLGIARKRVFLLLGTTGSDRTSPYAPVPGKGAVEAAIGWLPANRRPPRNKNTPAQWSGLYFHLQKRPGSWAVLLVALPTFGVVRLFQQPLQAPCLPRRQRGEDRCPYGSGNLLGLPSLFFTLLILSIAADFGVVALLARHNLRGAVFLLC